MDSEGDSFKTDLLLSLGPVQTPTRSEDTLADKISRINYQRANLGGFRTLTEEKLREDIAEKKATNEDGDESDSGWTEEEDDDEPDLTKELVNSRRDLLSYIDSAHQAALFALDFVSLSLSNNVPTQATSTVSPELQNLVGFGTIGLDKLNAPKNLDIRQHENQQIVTGWQVESLDKAVDLILASATRLKREIELETKYWEQILDIRNSGWIICRMPIEPQILGVTIGFSEALQSQSLVALHRNTDGSLSLDQGLSESDPQVIRVRIHTNGYETGSTKPPAPTPNNAPVEAFILQARNTIFAEELWQELQRETRTLLAYGVTSSISTITCVLTQSKKALIDLIPLSLDSSPVSSSITSLDDYLAEFLHISLHLSLRWAHRIVRRQRTHLQPSKASSNFLEPYPLIRPFLTRLTHEQTVTTLANFLFPLTTLLKKASIPASYSIIDSSTPLPASSSKAEQVLTTLTAHLESITMVKVLPGVELTLTTRTSTNRDMTPAFKIQINNDIAIDILCPPPTVFQRIDDVQEWISSYVSCAIASYLIDSLPKSNVHKWCLSVIPNVLKRETFGPVNISRYISVTISPIKDQVTSRDGLRLRVSWEKIDKVKEESDFLSNFLASTEINAEKEETKQNWKGIDNYDWIEWYEKDIDKGNDLNFEFGDEKMNVLRDTTHKSLLDVVRHIWNREMI